MFIAAISKLAGNVPTNLKKTSYILYILGWAYYKHLKTMQTVFIDTSKNWRCLDIDDL
jgi:hypothetical protein